MQNVDDTIRGFWRDLERNSGDADLWRIYCDYLEESEHPLSETTRLWVDKRFAQLSSMDHRRLIDNLRQQLRPLLPQRINSVGSELILIPKGTFWMSENGQQAQVEVTIEHGFYLGKYTVTQGEWLHLLGSNPSFFSSNNEGLESLSGYTEEELLRFPTEQVSWDDANRFIQVLNEKESDQELRYRLPSEVEWEYACRGASQTKAECQFRYYFSQPTDSPSRDQVNHDSTSPLLNRTAPVGSFESNILGLHEMHGNVDEWCEELLAGSGRIIRGGSFNDFIERCEASRRYGFSPDCRYNSIGFRLLAELK